jgi:hypothetical protein
MTVRALSGIPNQWSLRLSDFGTGQLMVLQSPATHFAVEHGDIGEVS